MSRAGISSSLLAVLLLSAACDLLGPIENRVPGRIVLDDPGDPPVVAPDSVDVDQTFDVTVTTAGGGCWRQGDTEVSAAADSAIIQPFDIQIIHRDGTLCPGYLRYHAHVVSLSFPAPGDKALVVRGRAFPGDSAVELRYTVAVR